MTYLRSPSQDWLVALAVAPAFSDDRVLAQVLQQGQGMAIDDLPSPRTVTRAQLLTLRRLVADDDPGLVGTVDMALECLCLGLRKSECVAECCRVLSEIGPVRTGDSDDYEEPEPWD